MNKQADIRTERGITLNDGRLNTQGKMKMKIYIYKKKGELIKTKQRNNEVKKKKGTNRNKPQN